MKTFTKLSLAALTLALLANEPGQAQIKAIASFAEPALSPDGKEIVLVSGGDIWTVPVEGGEARLLVSHADNESRPQYSPDGKHLAFTSTRTGNGDVYVLTLATGDLKRLTYDDGNDEVSAWSRDGKYIYFSSTSKEIASMADIFRIKMSGGTPMAVTDDRYTNEFFGNPSPDNNSLAFNARGIASRQWWRNGHSHLDESEIWLKRDGKTPTYERLTEGGAKELWPMWSPDGKTLFYVSDKSGAQNLWTKPLGGSPKQLTPFKDGRVLWPFIGYNGQTIVFERDFKIWKYSVATNQATPVTITRRGIASGPATEHVRQTSQFRELALSPDGKKIAFISHGEVFAAGAKDGGDAMRITNTVANESQPVWAPNSNSLVYISERDGTAHIYQYNFTTRQETRLTNDVKLDDATPVFAPDGKALAFTRNGQELRVLNLSSKKETVVAKGYLGRPPFASSGSVTWSPDSKWLAFAAYGAKSFRNISVVPVAGNTDAKPVSFLANTFGGSVKWTPDGRAIVYTTLQRTESGQVAWIDLIPQTPKFREDQFRELFELELPKTVTPLTPSPSDSRRAKSNARPDTIITAATTAAPSAKGTRVVFESIRQRLSLLPVGVDVNEQTISKDGKLLLILGTVAGQQNLYTYSIDELAREPVVAKQITATSGSKSNPQFSPDGKEIYYLEQGRVQTVNVESRVAKPVAVTAEMDVDFAREKVEVFRQAWEVQNKGFYDEKFHGVNWEKVKATYEPLAAGAHTPDELRRLLNLMVGELNASHSGVSGPPTGATPTTGRLGLRFDREEYEKTGKLKITEVIANSPAALTGTIKPGMYLRAVNDTLITPAKNLDQILENKINRRVSLTLSANGNTKDSREVVVRPVNQATEKGLLYKQWVQQQRDYVANVSGGKLGYVHMFDMSAESLNQYYLDLDAENHGRQGVVVDMRNNNGGFVNAYALDVLSRKGYMTMTVRGLPAAPARSQLGQRALEAPTILVTNQHSLSDAEDFTEGYQTMKLGKVVGEPTAGWIIYTSSASLLDGSTIRLPFIKVTDHAGKNMELASRPVDIKVSRPIGETYTGKDSQLDVAVKELLKQLGDGKNGEVGSGGK